MLHEAPVITLPSGLVDLDSRMNKVERYRLRFVRVDEMFENYKPAPWLIDGLADLRESGAIEQDADVVMFIYREDVYDQNSERKGIADIIVSKHRNGPIGKKELFFQDRYAKFESLDLRES